MAIQNANFNAGSYVKAGSKRVVTCTSNAISSNFKYRFYLELLYDGKTYAYTFRPNANGYGLINIAKILQSLVEPISVQQVLTIPDANNTLQTNSFQQNIHSMPHIINDSTDRYAYLSAGGSSAKRIQAKLWDFYSATADGVPARQGSPVTDYYYIIGGYQTSTGLNSETYDLYKLDSILTKRFISPLQGKFEPALAHAYKVDLSDFGSISILNRTADVNTSANTEKFKIIYYRMDGNLLAEQVFDNTTNYGGKYINGGVTDDAMVITFGCFPANLNKLPATYERPSDHPTTAYYTVTALNGTNTWGSMNYRFDIINRCKKYDAQRFAYINSFGVWEYITFSKRRTDEIGKKTTEIKTSVFDYTKSYSTISPIEYKENTYVPGVAHQNRKIVSSDSVASFTINTGYLEDYEIARVKEMFLSPNINYINTDGTALAVVLTNRSIEAVDVSHKNEQTEYALTFEYSVPKYNDIIF